VGGRKWRQNYYFRKVSLATIIADGESLFFNMKRIKKIRIKVLTVENSENNEFTLSELYFVGIK